MSETPPWVSEELFIQHILHTLLDKFERGVKPYLRINEKSAPQLYRFNDEDTDYLWELLTQLDKHYQLITIKKSKQRFPEAHYHKSQLYLLEDKIPLLRDWLDRPALDAYSTVWQIMVKEYSAKLPAEIQADFNPLYDNAIRYGSASAESLVQAFCRIPKVLNKAMSLRSLSAKCFWGDSKFLDYRSSLVKALFPKQAHFLEKRPLMINVYLAGDFKQIVFIENQDSFLMMQALCKETALPVALVYSAGFRGTAQRVREPGAVVWSFLDNVETATRVRFQNWWFNESPEQYPVRFWGDLDFAGMAILAALRKSFPQLQAWQAAYDLMLEHLENGQAHDLASAGKEKQRPPLATGCEYADRKLLPVLRESQCAVDQEIIDIDLSFFE